MKRIFASILLCGLLLTGCAQTPPQTPAQAPDTPSIPPQPPAEDVQPPEEDPAAQRQERLEALVDSMTLEEQVGQLFFVRCPAENALEDLQTYHLGGYLLFGRDFKDHDTWLTRQQLLAKLQSYQDASAIPLFIGSDEEGGTVTRASRNPNLFAAPFSSPQALYAAGGMDAVVQDAQEKNQALRELGINVNFAPVCDISTDPADFIYPRTLGQDTALTSDFVTQTVQAMEETGMLPVLKHFPGYGNNADTHTGIALDQRPMETFLSCDLLPFQAGIDAGAPFVLVSHNIVACMDENLPASLSPQVHQLLREKLGFEGLAITDDLAMDAVKAYAPDGAVAVLALLAGNDMVITTDYPTQIPAVIAAAEQGTLSKETIRQACLRVLECKDQWLSLPESDA